MEKKFRKYYNPKDLDEDERRERALEQGWDEDEMDLEEFEDLFDEDDD